MKINILRKQLRFQNTKKIARLYLMSLSKDNSKGFEYII